MCFFVFYCSDLLFSLSASVLCLQLLDTVGDVDGVFFSFEMMAVVAVGIEFLLMLYLFHLWCG